jgi:hypothetical protein
MQEVYVEVKDIEFMRSLSDGIEHYKCTRGVIAKPFCPQ